MKKIIGIILLACGLVSCSSCTGPKTGPTVPDGTSDAGVDATSSPVTITNSNWSLTFPNSNWSVDPAEALNALRDGGDPATMTPFINEVDKNLLIVVTQPFPGTTQQMALLAVRGMTEQGGTLLLSKPLVINGANFVFFESQRSGDNKVWAWISAKDGVGYSIACGGLEDSDAAQFLLCDQIASTFKIK